MYKMFEVGDRVKISEYNDNENYNEFRGKLLIITHVATNQDEHPGYDDSMGGEGLYELMVDETGEEVPFSLYDYELEEW